MRLEGKLGSAGLYELLSAPGRGEVLGVFSSGVYFSLGGKTLMLHDSSYGTLPFGIGIDAFGNKAKTLDLEPGMEALSDKGLLVFPEGCLSISLRLEPARMNAADIACLPDFLEKASALLESSGRSALSIYAGGFPPELKKEEIEDIFAVAAYEGLRALSHELESGIVPEEDSAVSRLIGLGRGLTPSLDDFLCGMLCVLGYGEKNWGINIPALEGLRSRVKVLAPEKTNACSAPYLLAAAEGGDFSLMRDCLESCSAQREKRLNSLLLVGGSSGADMLCGMCFAANYILKQRRFTL